MLLYENSHSQLEYWAYFGVSVITHTTRHTVGLLDE
jgi:hypothetical protein